MGNLVCGCIKASIDNSEVELSGNVTPHNEAYHSEHKDINSNEYNAEEEGQREISVKYYEREDQNNQQQLNDNTALSESKAAAEKSSSSCTNRILSASNNIDNTSTDFPNEMPIDHDFISANKQPVNLSIVRNSNQDDDGDELSQSTQSTLAPSEDALIAGSLYNHKNYAEYSSYKSHEKSLVKPMTINLTNSTSDSGKKHLIIDASLKHVDVTTGYDHERVTPHLPAYAAHNKKNTFAAVVTPRYDNTEGEYLPHLIQQNNNQPPNDTKVACEDLTALSPVDVAINNYSSRILTANLQHVSTTDEHKKYFVHKQKQLSSNYNSGVMPPLYNELGKLGSSSDEDNDNVPTNEISAGSGDSSIRRKLSFVA